MGRRRFQPSGCIRKILMTGFLLAVLAVLSAGTARAGIRPDYDDPDYLRLVERERQSAAMPRLRFTDEEANKYTGLVYGHSDIFKDCTIVNGVDVSYWQGSRSSGGKMIDWKKVKADGIDFAIVRLGYSTLSDGTSMMDPDFEYNLNGARAAGLKVGVYYYAQSINLDEVKREAEFVLEHLKGVKLDFPVVFDSEKPTGGRLKDADIDMETYTGFAEYFCELIKAGGYTPMVYSSVNGMRKNYDGQRLEKNWSIWLARYPLHEDTALLGTQYDGKYDIWQYSSSGVVDGINGRTDMDFYYMPSGKNMDFHQVKNLKVKKRSGCAFKITFSAVKNAISYEIWRSESRDGTFEMIAEQSARTYRDTGLERGKEYYYKVRANVSIGDEYIPGVFSDVVGNYHPFAGTMQIQLTTAANLRKRPGTNHEVVKVLDVDTICDVTALASNSEGIRWYLVKALVGSETYEGYVSSRVSRVLVGRVTGLRAYKTRARSLVLAWTPVEAASGYEIYFSTSETGAYRQLAVVPAGKTKLTHKNLKSYCQYYYRIRAFTCEEEVYTYGSFSEDTALNTKAVKRKMLTKKSIPLREQASPGGKILFVLPKGSVVKMTLRTRDSLGNWWYYVSCKAADGESTEGYLPASALGKTK